METVGPFRNDGDQIRKNIRREISHKRESLTYTAAEA
jgi:hypothetical protein